MGNEIGEKSSRSRIGGGGRTMKGRWRKREGERRKKEREKMKQLEMHRKAIIGMTADPANEELSREKRGPKARVAPQWVRKAVVVVAGLE